MKVVGQGRLRHTGQPPRRQDRGRGAMGHFSLSARGPETSPCQCKSSLVHHSPQSRWRGCIFLFPHQSHPFPPCLRNSSHCHGNSNTKSIIAVATVSRNRLNRALRGGQKHNIYSMQTCNSVTSYFMKKLIF